MNKFLLLTVISGISFFIFSCKEKKVSLSENDEKVDARTFVEFFQPLKLPYEVTDTVFRKKDAEANLINYHIFTRILPDSLVTKYFGAAARPHLYAVGSVTVPGNETYVFVKALTAARKVLYILCFDKSKKFVAGRPVLYVDNEPGVSAVASMDAKYTLTLTHERKGNEGQVFYKKDAYVFNTDPPGFMLIMTEGNETKTKVMPVYNPIDTFQHKHKFTGDYAQDKRNLISVRDGKDVSRILFFVHFEKDDGACKGELKGEARFVSASTARYHSNGDPCTIEFTFDGAGVAMKELDGCGNHRDIKCFFEGYFLRREEPRNKSKTRPLQKK